MGLLLEAAIAWNDLHNVSYILDVTKKGSGTVKRIELSFLDEDFPHAAGMQYAGDVDFGIRPNQYYGAKLIPALLTGQMIDTKIESGLQWNKISGRLTALVHLQTTLDGSFLIRSFEKGKVPGYSAINAKFIIQSTISDEMYFVFLDERSNKYYCKSAFKKEKTDFMKNQTLVTVLQKTKTIDGVPHVLYTKDGYIPNETVL